MRLRNLSFILLSIIYCTSCSEDQTQQPSKAEETHSEGFRILSPNKSGIAFYNKVKETIDKNYFNFEYIYNGGGVAVGDINNDGLEDVFFTGNEVENQLYLNEGDLKFKDISKEAKIGGNGAWHTGVTMVDINRDGYLDIYVCKSGWPTIERESRQNLLFINQQDNTFAEKAKEYGLADASFSVQSSFFDFDKDGDLDMYLTNHPVAEDMELQARLAIRKSPPEDVRDKLYRNNGDNTFTDVSRKAGIVNYGHGLGLVTADINKDGNVDIYVANDFKEPDYLYINNGDGTFTDRINDFMAHIAFYAMGVDIADINNDGEEDIFVAEMLPFDYKRSKTNMASMDVQTFEGMKALGLHHQYMHNVMQLNSGPLPGNPDDRRFSDVSQMAGISKTDWSWSCLLEDFDNDGMRDLFVANGFKHDVFNKDYKETANSKAAALGRGLTIEELLEVMPQEFIPNQIYKNITGLEFKNKTKQWGINRPMLSQGAAVGDLDNDGDIDLVLNNLNEPSVIIENTSANEHFLRVKALDANGVHYQNAKITLKTASGFQYFESKATRGFQSCSSPVAHFGLGDKEAIDYVEVAWLDGSITRLTDVLVDSLVEIRKESTTTTTPKKPQIEPAFVNTANKFSPAFKHKEKVFDDYRKQVLLPHKFSQNGPFLSKGDSNGDGLEDVFVGGGADQAGSVYVQQSNGNFIKANQPALKQDRAFEDMGSVWFDSDSDGDQDLFVVSGSSEFGVKSPMYQCRLYTNDGKGSLTRQKDAIPETVSSCQHVSVCDYDGDGDFDLFVGGRIFPDHYPFGTFSYLLNNDNGKFTDVSKSHNLQSLGMVTSSTWNDIDSDGDQDIIIVGEWMPITIMLNEGGQFRNATTEFGLGNTAGWWNTIEAGDLDNDGDQDFVIGNLGVNHKFHASVDKPFHVYCGDYDNNGSFDVVLAKEYNDKLVPIRGRECSSQQMPFIKEETKNYEEFASLDIKGLLGARLDKWLHMEANLFESIALINRGGSFDIVALPREAQLSPMNGVALYDVDGDERLDIIYGGNMYQTEAETSRADASFGGVILNATRDKVAFEFLSLQESGIYWPYDVKDVIAVNKDENTSVLATVNNGPLQVAKRTR